MKFINALTINEKYAILNKSNEKMIFNKQALIKFRELKSLLNEDNFSKMLEKFDYDIDIFSNVVDMENNKYDKQYENFLLSSKWYQVYSDSLKYTSQNKYFSDMKSLDLTIYLKIFEEYFKKEIAKVLLEYDNYIDSVQDLTTSLVYQIKENMMKISYKSLIVELNNYREQNTKIKKSSEEGFLNFCKLGTDITNIENYYSKYPVLCRLLATNVDNEIENIKIFFERYSQNLNSISNVLGFISNTKLKNIELGEGDSHQKGQTVIKILLEGNRTIIYKPKDLRVVTYYNNILNKINNNIENELSILNFKVYKGFYSKYFSIEEFVEQKPCETRKEVKEYYIRFGQLLCLMHFFSGKDLHMENLIANGKYPVVTDLEMILQKSKKFPKELSSLYKKMILVFNKSVLSSGLLPEDMTHFNINLSALSGGKEKNIIKAQKIVNLGLDTMKLEEQELEIEKSNNLVIHHSEEIDYHEYNREIIEGFNNLYNFILGNPDVLSEDVPDDFIVRHLLRNTQNYASLLEATYHPGYLKNSILRENILMNLFSNEYDDNILINEYNDLISNDIPIFFNRVDDDHLYSSDMNVCSEKFFIESCSKRETGSLRDKELQKSLLISKIYKYNNLVELKERNYDESNVALAKGFNELEEACVIGDWIISKAYSNEKEASFFTFGYDEKSVSPLIMNNSLYSGHVGIALFFYYLSKVSKKNKYYDFYEKLLYSIEHNKYTNSNDLFNGETGKLYLYYRLYVEEKDASYLEKVDEITSLISIDLEENLQKNDWINGISSLANVYLNIFTETSNHKYLELPTICAEIIKQQLSTTKLGGFSHGYSSLAFLFFKIGNILEDKEYTDIGKKLITLDNEYFKADKGSWIDNREDVYNKYPSYWCHGSLGIGISRMKIKDYYNDSVIENDVRIAEQHITSNKLSDDDTLCHGNSGRIDFYLGIGREDLAKKIMSKIIDKKYTSGTFGVKNINDFNLPDYSMFTGIVGIGYQMLRITARETVPSVLTLD
ncbi:type 2 lanthipeptide synthetase LanM [Marinilactibacillus sp. Marseille-P9653]|uniref:type 2 lanthipeptide synthetase LanM n=1 Tax=Marinilactibacillus sp. Marseille-P9653 TaxID=2866583 RepID=UPI001CE43853|nr:type 2 lanthipeptide synthetase LanM [Marinilactibacillus sp. Marseille-P9653]